MLDYFFSLLSLLNIPEGTMLKNNNILPNVRKAAVLFLFMWVGEFVG